MRTRGPTMKRSLTMPTSEWLCHAPSAASEHVCGPFSCERSFEQTSFGAIANLCLATLRKENRRLLNTKFRSRNMCCNVAIPAGRATVTPPLHSHCSILCAMHHAFALHAAHPLGVSLIVIFCFYKRFVTAKSLRQTSSARVDESPSRFVHDVPTYDVRLLQ